jgi:hypothetical protein
MCYEDEKYNLWSGKPCCEFKDEKYKGRNQFIRGDNLFLYVY